MEKMKILNKGFYSLKKRKGVINMSKDTRVRPFSNHTEFEWWQERNCDRCCRYSNVSSKRKNAKCRLAFDLDFASIDDGTIRRKTAEMIGLSNGSLKNRCNDFNKPLPTRNKPQKKADINQYNLFR